jgi:hypothetical protein
MHSNEAVEKLRDFLHKYLVDPLNRKGNYVYADDFRKELNKSSYPLINLRKLDQQSESEIRQIGSKTRTVSYPVVLEIIGGASHTYGVGERKYTAQQLLSNLGQNVEIELRDRRDELCDEGFDSVLVQDERYIRNEDKTLKMEMTIQLKFPSP